MQLLSLRGEPEYVHYGEPSNAICKDRLAELAIELEGSPLHTNTEVMTICNSMSLQMEVMVIFESMSAHKTCLQRHMLIVNNTYHVLLFL